MSILSGVTEFFGLDIGTTGIRAVQLKGAGDAKALYTYGQTATAGELVMSDSKTDRETLARNIKSFLDQIGITSKNVAVNVPSNRVFTAVIDMNKMTPEELDKTMRYQADSLIPTPIAQSKLDWVILGDSPKDPHKVEILLSSVPNEYIENRLSMLESIGLNVVAIEPDNMALARAVMAPDSATAQMALDIGNSSTDLIVAFGDLPRLSRALPFGGQTIVKAAQGGLGVEEAQASQYVYKFGLGRDKLDGQIFNAIQTTVESLMSEIEKSVKFFQARYPNAKLDRIIVTGGASAIPEFPLYIANKFGINVEIGNAWRNVSYPSSQQNQLLAVSNHFAVASGLAQRDT